MPSFDHSSVTGSAHHLMHHLGNPDTAIVSGAHYILPEPNSPLPGRLSPDLFIAFNVDRAAYVARNAYIISEPGKPPDFVLEIASPRTAHIDIGAKRRDYAALGILEYWRFDETGRHIATFADERAARRPTEARVRELEAELRRRRNR